MHVVVVVGRAPCVRHLRGQFSELFGGRVLYQALGLRIVSATNCDRHRLQDTGRMFIGGSRPQPFRCPTQIPMTPTSSLTESADRCRAARSSAVRSSWAVSFRPRAPT